MRSHGTGTSGIYDLLEILGAGLSAVFALALEAVRGLLLGFRSGLYRVKPLVPAFGFFLHNRACEGAKLEKKIEPESLGFLVQ
jgi:hypothetical protein